MTVVERIDSHVDEIYKKLNRTFRNEKGPEMVESVRKIVREFTEKLREHPLQTIGTAVAFGFLIARILHGRKSTMPKFLGKGIGALLAVSFLEKTSPLLSSKSEERGLPH